MNKELQKTIRNLIEEYHKTAVYEYAGIEQEILLNRKISYLRIQNRIFESLICGSLLKKVNTSNFLWYSIISMKTPTELCYMVDMECTEFSATIIEKTTIEEKETLILDKTMFYPQGGGQPSDQGIIKSEDNEKEFIVSNVRYNKGFVYHFGITEKGNFNEGDSVKCKINKELRSLHSRLHSAGHVVDLAVHNLSIDWKPGKGYHYEKGAYIEYEGSLEGLDIESLKKNIEDECNNCIEKDLITTLEFHNDAHESGKQKRTVYYGDFGINCGGTHVAHLGIIGKISIRKIKKEKDMIRVSYEILSK